MLKGGNPFMGGVYTKRTLGNQALAPVLLVVVMIFLPGFVLSSGCMAEQRPLEKPGAVIELYSDAFRNGGEIPPVYTCKGQNISPRITWSNIPEGTRSFALIVEDPDAPGGIFTHWVIYNIPSEKRALSPSIPPQPSFEDGTRQGTNDYRKIGYAGPCCPPGRPHRYYFRMYALDTTLPTTEYLDRSGLLKRMEGHILGRGELMGLFQR